MRQAINDAQVDRLLRALRRADQKPGLSDYGKQLAEKIATRDKIAYRSAERRLQRYITTAGERRAFVSAPVRYQRELRQEARRTPPPPLPLPKPKPLPPREDIYRPAAPPRELAPRLKPPASRFEREAEPEHTSLYELRAIIAYYDGELNEAARALNVDARLLDLVSQGITISRRMGAGKIDEGVERLYERLAPEDIQDIQDFSDMLYDRPDWEIKMILDDLADGDTSFADWMDLWREHDMDTDSLEDSPEFWALWRAAYKKVKK